MARSKSSGSWLREHFSDPYVKQAKKDNYRSRAVYKLLEIQERDRFLKPGMAVVDLGAAPGSWSQVTKEILGNKGMVIALDILPMEPLAGVGFIQGDFREDEVLGRLMERLQGQFIDVVLSDMAPNTSGDKDIDQPRSLYLAELALDFARKTLKPQGDLLVKLFQGGGTEAYLTELKGVFERVLIRKPEASRKRSPEVYVLARGYRV